MTSKHLKMIAAAAFWSALAAHAADYIVVANAGLSVSELSGDELKQVFLGSKTSVAGAAVEPVLAEQGTAHEEFLKTCVGKSDAALRNHFKSMVFTGKGSMPKSFKSDAAIVQYVARTKGAIGYVSPASAGPEVKKLNLK